MWSIGIYKGDSVFNLSPHPDIANPVILPKDITDVKAVSIADPFMLRTEAQWHMFFEILDGETGKGCIGLATSDDALKWNYQQIVLNEKGHLSYPYVFKAENNYYMIPETVEGGGISLYKAEEFPAKWSFERTLIEGKWADPSIFEYRGKWWMFACGNPKESNSLHLFHADSLLGTWSEHPLSPLITSDASSARPAGRVIVQGESVVRFSQDCVECYGNKVRAFEVTELSETKFAEREHHLSPILVPTGSGWNSERMHHVDPHLTWPDEWIACVDGLTEG